MEYFVKGSCRRKPGKEVTRQGKFDLAAVIEELPPKSNVLSLSVLKQSFCEGASGNFGNPPGEAIVEGEELEREEH